MTKNEEKLTGISADWKKQLKAMKLAYLKSTAPGFYELSGGERMIVKGYSDETANGLTKCICDWITYSGGYSNRISTTGMLRKINGEMKWTKGNSNKGAADIRILINGISADVEVKVGRDVASDKQKREQQSIEMAGGHYFIARDMPSFIEWFCRVQVVPELYVNVDNQHNKCNNK